MDDFSVDVLYHARDEYTARAVSTMSRCVLAWLDGVFVEVVRLCLENHQPEQYIRSLQRVLETVKDWNAVAVEKECARLKTECAYFDVLLSCVLVTQIKLLSCGRTGSRMKKVAMSAAAFAVPAFLHRVYVNVAREMYRYPFLFEHLPDDTRKTQQRFECKKMVDACVLASLRDSVPAEDIARAYTDESVEQEEHVHIEPEAAPGADRVEEIRQAKRRALGLAREDEDEDDRNDRNNDDGRRRNDRAGGGGGLSAVKRARRGPDPGEEEEAEEDFAADADFLGGAVHNLDAQPIVSRVEFNDEVFCAPPVKRDYEGGEGGPDSDSDVSDDDDDDDDCSVVTGSGAAMAAMAAGTAVSLDDLF